jgi:hypothetical protein
VPKKAKEAAKGSIPAELYNLTDDLGEEKNVAARNPDKVKELDELLKKVRAGGRSRPKK